MEDRRAHERIDILEVTVKKHIEAHAKFEASIEENTKLTRSIADNTAELVALIRGAKGLRSFVVWVSPVMVAGAAAWVWLRMAAK